MWRLRQRENNIPFSLKKLKILAWFPKINYNLSAHSNLSVLTESSGFSQSMASLGVRAAISSAHFKNFFDEWKKTPPTFMRTVFTHQGGKSMQVSVHVWPCLPFHTIFYLWDAKLQHTLGVPFTKDWPLLAAPPVSWHIRHIYMVLCGQRLRLERLWFARLDRTRLDRARLEAFPN